ncbi:unnamed protein product [Prorocentrum cordatum]|nr:unnamed protein product [Polarella glacialis]
MSRMSPIKGTTTNKTMAGRAGNPTAALAVRLPPTSTLERRQRPLRAPPLLCGRTVCWHHGGPNGGRSKEGEVDGVEDEERAEELEEEEEDQSKPKMHAA